MHIDFYVFADIFCVLALLIRIKRCLNALHFKAMNVSIN